MADIRDLVHAAEGLLEHLTPDFGFLGNNDRDVPKVTSKRIREALKEMQEQYADFDGVTEADHDDVVILAGELAHTQWRAIRGALWRAEQQAKCLEQAEQELFKYPRQERQRGERKRRKGIIDKHFKPLLKSSGGDEA